MKASIQEVRKMIVKINALDHNNPLNFSVIVKSIASVLSEEEMSKILNLSTKRIRQYLEGDRPVIESDRSSIINDLVASLKFKLNH